MLNIIDLFTISDIRLLLLEKLNEQNIYMLYLSCKAFYEHTKVNYRSPRICMKSAIKNKSISYIKFVMNTRAHDEECPLSEYDIARIIDTNDMNIIKCFIKSPLDKGLCYFLIKKILNCSFDICVYLLNGNFKNCIKQIVKNGRMDVIDLMIEMGMEKKIIKHIRNKRTLSNHQCSKKISFLCYLRKIEYTISPYIINREALVTNLEYTTWIIDNTTSEIKIFITSVIQTTHISKINIDILFLLYENKYEYDYEISEIVYEVAYCNNIVHRIKPEHRIHIPTENTVLYDVSNNIFNIGDIILHCKTHTSQYTVLYYMIKYNRFDLCKKSLFTCSQLIKDVVYLYKNHSLDYILNYVNDVYNNSYNSPIKEHIDFYKETENDPEAMKMYIENSRLSYYKLEKFHKYKLFKLCHFIIDNFNNVKKFYKLSISRYFVYASKSNDIKLTKFLFSMISVKCDIKYFSLETLLEIGIFDKNKIFIDDALKYGDNKIVNYILNNFELQQLNYYSMWSNNPKLLEYVIKTRFVENIKLSNFINDSNIEIVGDDRYLAYLFTFNFILDENIIDCAVLYSNIQLIIFIVNKNSDDILSLLIERILMTDKLKILSAVMEIKKIKFSPENIQIMINYNSWSIIDHLVSLGKIQIPSNIIEFL